VVVKLEVATSLAIEEAARGLRSQRLRSWASFSSLLCAGRSLLARSLRSQARLRGKLLPAAPEPLLLEVPLACSLRLRPRHALLMVMPGHDVN